MFHVVPPSSTLVQHLTTIGLVFAGYVNTLFYLIRLGHHVFVCFRRENIQNVIKQGKKKVFPGKVNEGKKHSWINLFYVLKITVFGNWQPSNERAGQKKNTWFFGNAQP